MNFELLTQLVINGLIVGLLYGVIGMCFVLVYKSTQVVNFAQGEFLLIGAWVCWASLIYLELPFFVGFLLSLLFMAGFGVLLQMIVLRYYFGDYGHHWFVYFLPSINEMDLWCFTTKLPTSI